MNIQELTETQVLSQEVLQQAVGNEDSEMELRLRAKKLKVTTLFDKKMKNFKKKLANEKMNRLNFCEFNDERFENICTGSWKATEQGISKQVPNNDTGDIDLVEASRMMLAPTEILLNVDSGEERAKVAFYKHGKWNEITCDKSTLSISHRIVELSNKGIDITTNNCRDMVDYFYDCFTLNDEEGIPFYNSLSRMGWHNNDFMPYSTNIKFDGDQQNKYLYNCLSQKGDREKWIEYVAELRNSKYLRLQMAVSLASVLVSRLNLLPFILHMWGKTGSGKTVGTIVAMSMWGNPTMGNLTKSMNNTLNSVMDTCAFMCNLPVALDELQLIKDKLGYDKFVMMLCEGVERGRMKFDENKQTRSWKNAFLFTGEEPITSVNSGGGVFNRVIEIDVTGKEVVDASKGEEIVEFVSNNYGLIAEEIISNVVRDIEEIKSTYKALNEQIKGFTETTTKQSSSMALILLGDHLLRKYFFKDEANFTKDEIKEFIFTDEEVDATKRAYEYIIGVISCNTKRFTDVDNHGEIWGKFEDDAIYIQRQKLHELLKNGGFDLKAVIKTWSDDGKIIKNSQGKFAHNTSKYGVKTNYIVFQRDFDDIEGECLPSKSEGKN